MNSINFARFRFLLIKKRTSIKMRQGSSPFLILSQMQKEKFNHSLNLRHSFL